MTGSRGQPGTVLEPLTRRSRETVEGQVWRATLDDAMHSSKAT